MKRKRVRRSNLPSRPQSPRQPQRERPSRGSRSTGLVSSLMEEQPIEPAAPLAHLCVTSCNAREATKGMLALLSSSVDYDPVASAIWKKGDKYVYNPQPPLRPRAYLIVRRAAISQSPLSVAGAHLCRDRAVHGTNRDHSTPHQHVQVCPGALAERSSRLRLSHHQQGLSFPTPRGSVRVLTRLVTDSARSRLPTRDSNWASVNRSSSGPWLRRPARRIPSSKLSTRSWVIWDSSQWLPETPKSTASPHFAQVQPKYLLTLFHIISFRTGPCSRHRP